MIPEEIGVSHDELERAMDRLELSDLANKQDHTSLSDRGEWREQTKEKSDRLYDEHRVKTKQSIEGHQEARFDGMSVIWVDSAMQGEDIWLIY